MKRQTSISKITLLSSPKVLKVIFLGNGLLAPSWQIKRLPLV